MIFSFSMTYFDYLIDFLFPRRCVSCQTPGAYICRSCKKELVPHPEQCPFCHRITRYSTTCPDCFVDHKELAWVMIAFVYTQQIKKLILALKFYHQYDCAAFLAQRLSLLIQTNPELVTAHSAGKLYISYVPSHRRRKRMVKWYNQSELLAHHVAKNLDIPLIQWLKKHKHTASQTTRSKGQRATNLQNAFSSIWTAVLPLWATLIIIDDITTTGATLRAVAKERKKLDSTLRIRWIVVWRHGK